MGYVIPHIYILTGDKRFKADFEKQIKRDTIGIALTGVACLLLLIGGGIYSILSAGGY